MNHNIGSEGQNGGILTAYAATSRYLPSLSDVFKSRPGHQYSLSVKNIGNMWMVDQPMGIDGMSILCVCLNRS